jgi:hypothetical protein
MEGQLALFSGHMEQVVVSTLGLPVSMGIRTKNHCIGSDRRSLRLLSYGEPTKVGKATALF